MHFNLRGNFRSSAQRVPGTSGVPFVKPVWLLLVPGTLPKIEMHPSGKADKTTNELCIPSVVLSACFSSMWLSFIRSKGLSRNKIVNLRDVTQVNLSKIIHVNLGQTLSHRPRLT